MSNNNPSKLNSIFFPENGLASVVPEQIVINQEKIKIAHIMINSLIKKMRKQIKR